MSIEAKTRIKEAIDGFLLNCRVKGKSYGTIECYSDKLKGFQKSQLPNPCIVLLILLFPYHYALNIIW
ncbi:hypothetical protein ACFLVJ_01500 [Chloroflexota bacterium]